MSLIVKDRVYEQMTEGLHNVTITKVEDLGVQDTKFGSKDQARIYFTALDQTVPQILAGGDMARLGGPDEVVVRDPQRRPQVAEVRLHLVAVLLRRQAPLLRGLLDLLAVFVDARQEEDVLPEPLVEARQHVRQDGAVRVPDVRLVVDVVDGRRDVEDVGRGHGRFAPKEGSDV